MVSSPWANLRRREIKCRCKTTTRCNNRTCSLAPRALTANKDQRAPTVDSNRTSTRAPRALTLTQVDKASKDHRARLAKKLTSSFWRSSAIDSRAAAPAQLLVSAAHSKSLTTTVMVSSTKKNAQRLSMTLDAAWSMMNVSEFSSCSIDMEMVKLITTSSCGASVEK